MTYIVIQQDYSDIFKSDANVIVCLLSLVIVMDFSKACTWPKKINIMDLLQCRDVYISVPPKHIPVSYG